MNNPLSRRRFLNATARTGLSLAGLGLLELPRARAVEPIQRAGKPRLLLTVWGVGYKLRPVPADAGDI